MEAFRYTPLADITQSVRMLILSAGSGNDPLRGSLIDFDMNQASKEVYEPLSYVWGNPSRDCDFICDGKILKVTSSLHQALQRLRLPDKDRRLWADQICINQEDLHERGNQVQFMNAIYKHANHVLVWLGPDDKGEAEAAFGLVKDLALTFSDKEKYDRFKEDHSGKNVSDRSKEYWEPIKDLTRLPWVS